MRRERKRGGGVGEREREKRKGGNEGQQTGRRPWLCIMYIQRELIVSQGQVGEGLCKTADFLSGH